MAVKRIRVDSVKELQEKKSTAEIQKENEELKNKVADLTTQLEQTQLALCEVYEQVIAATSTGEV